MCRRDPFVRALPDAENDEREHEALVVPGNQYPQQSTRRMTHDEWWEDAEACRQANVGAQEEHDDERDGGDGVNQGRLDDRLEDLAVDDNSFPDRVVCTAFLPGPKDTPQDESYAEPPQ